MSDYFTHPMIATTPEELYGRGPRVPSIQLSSRGNSGEINQLWTDLTRTAILHNMKMCRPKVDRALFSSVDPLMGLSRASVLGKGLIPFGWKQAGASVALPTSVANTALLWAAVSPGEAGNGISVRYVNGGAVPTVITYNPTTRVVTVTLNTGGAVTANAVIAALAASVDAKYAVMAANPFTSTGVGVINQAVLAVPLAGGLGKTLVKSSVTVDPAGTNNGLVFDSRIPGVGGNGFDARFTIGALAGPVVTTLGSSVRVQIRAAATTANDVIWAISMSENARRLVSVRNQVGSSGAGTIPGAVAGTYPLVGGGYSSGTAVKVGGEPCSISTITDSGVQFDIPALQDSQLLGEEVLCEVDICGYHHEFPVKLESRLGDNTPPVIYEVDAATLAVAGDTATIVRGKGLIPSGWNQANRTIPLPVPVANTSLDWLAVQPGVAGNTVGIEYVNSDAGTAVTWDPVTRTITVGYLLAGAVTAANIVTALAADATARTVVMARHSFGSTGAGVLNQAVPRVMLAGGLGSRYARASLTIDPAGANNEITFEARKAGPVGESITVAYTTGAAAGPVVSVDRNAVSIQIAAGASTAALVLAAVAASAAARELISAYHVYGSTSAGTIPAAVAAASLAGGTLGTLAELHLGGEGGGAVGFCVYNDENLSFDHAAIGESAATELIACKFVIGGHVQFVDLTGV